MAEVTKKLIAAEFGKKAPPKARKRTAAAAKPSGKKGTCTITASGITFIKRNVDEAKCARVATKFKGTYTFG
jgi:hypothetical protein